MTGLRRHSLFMSTAALTAAVSMSPAHCAATPPSIRQTWLNAREGVELRVLTGGTANAANRSIVFIPGWSTGADIWQQQMSIFARAYPVISFDPRSQGLSSKTSGDNTPEARADDLRAMIIHEGLHRPVLVAWSQAVQDVAAYVLKYGTGGISGIVFVDAAVSDGAASISERPQQSARQFELFATYQADQRAYLRGMFNAIISHPQAGGMIERAVSVGMKTPPSIGISMLVADMFGKDRTAALGKIDCPVLIIAAASSNDADRQKAELERLKEGRFVQIQDSAHAVFLDQPVQFADALSGFLASLPSKTIKPMKGSR